MYCVSNISIDCNSCGRSNRRRCCMSCIFWRNESCHRLVHVVVGVTARVEASLIQGKIDRVPDGVVVVERTVPGQIIREVVEV